MNDPSPIPTPCDKPHTETQAVASQLLSLQLPSLMISLQALLSLNLSLTRIMLMLTVPPPPPPPLLYSCNPERMWGEPVGGDERWQEMGVWGPVLWWHRSANLFSLSVPHSVSSLLLLPHSPCLLSLSFSLKWCVPPVIYIILFWHLYFSHQSRYLLSVYLLSEHVSSLSGHAQKINFTVFLPSFFPCKIQSSRNDRSKIMKTTMQAIFFCSCRLDLKILFLTSLCAICLRKGLLCIFFNTFLMLLSRLPCGGWGSVEITYLNQVRGFGFQNLWNN